MHVFYTYPTSRIHDDKQWKIILEDIHTYEQYTRDCMDDHYEKFSSDNDWQFVKNEEFPWTAMLDKVNWKVDYLGDDDTSYENNSGGAESIQRHSNENEWNYTFRFPQGSLLQEKAKELLEVDWVKTNLVKQPPGNVIPQHVDWNYSTVEKIPEHHELYLYQIHKSYWFPKDQQPGQKFRIGRDWIEWKAGDIVWWPWYMEHNTENVSDSDRPSVHITSCTYETR